MGYSEEEIEFNEETDLKEVLNIVIEEQYKGQNNHLDENENKTVDLNLGGLDEVYVYTFYSYKYEEITRYSNGAKNGVGFSKYGITIKDNTPFDENLPYFKFKGGNDDLLMLEIYNNNTEIDDAKLIYGVTDEPMTFDGSYESLNKLNLINEIPLKDNLIEGKEDNFVYIPLEVKETFTYLYVFMEYTKDGITRYSNNVKKNEIIPLNSTFYYNVFPITQNVEKYKNSITLWNSSLILDNDLDEMKYTVDLFGEELNTNLFEDIVDIEDSGSLRGEVIKIKNNDFVEFNGILDNVEDDKGILLLHKNRRNLKLVNNGIHESYYFKNKETFNKYLDIYDIFLGEKASFIIITGLEKNKVTKDSKMLLFEVMLDDKFNVSSLHKLFPESKNGKEYLDTYKKEGSLISTPLKYIGDHLILNLDLKYIGEDTQWKYGTYQYPNHSTQELSEYMKTNNSFGDFIFEEDLMMGNLNHSDVSFYIGNTLSKIPLYSKYHKDFVILNKYDGNLNTLNIINTENYSLNLGQLNIKKDLEIKEQVMKSNELIDKYKFKGILSPTTDGNSGIFAEVGGILDDIIILIKSTLNNVYYMVLELDFNQIEDNKLAVYNFRNNSNGRYYADINSHLKLGQTYDIEEVREYKGNLTHSQQQGTRMTEKELEQLVETFKEVTKDSPYEHIFYDK